ncbi:MAG: hypothetical protein K0S11_1176, partial [Gammaproteobacteria bacterium]|nr:hypothetical protein [Gammaproteobacteria bacterium]
KKFFNRQQSKARPGGRLGKLLKDIKAEAIKAEILNGQKQLEGKSHQSFITKDFKLKKDNESGYKFYSALSDWYENLYLKMPDSQPSSEVESASKTIVPSFRGVALWEKKDTTGLDGFLNRSEGPGKSYPSTAYHLAEVSFMDYVLEKVDLELLERMGQVYDLQPLKDKLLSDNKVEEKLDQASAQLKAMLDDTDNVTGSFDEFGDYFGKDLFFANEKFSEYKKGKKGKKEKKEQGAEFVNRGKDTSFKLGDIISHIYTNAYARFQKILENNLLSFTKKEQPAGLEGRLAEKTQQLLTNISELATNKNDSKKGMPILSEGQIPRHALLYATHNKQYNIDNKLTPTNLYENDGKPISFYLGKLYINTYSTDKINGKSVKYIPAEHQKENVSIGAVIGGEQEIQHRGGNNNKAEKVITIKLPKFNLKEFPQRYQDKYGLTKELWKAFKDGFKQLNDAGLWNTAASFYLESLILTHLIEFHEAMSTALVAEKGSIHMMGTRDKADVENKDFEVKFHLIEQHSDVKELKGFSHKVHEINPKESNIQEE